MCRLWISEALCVFVEEMLSSSRRPILGEKRNSKTIRQEAGALHGSGCFCIAHECFPDKLRAGILRHQHTDADVDPEHILAGPTCERVESVHEAVLFPYLLAVIGAHIFQSSD